jgi:hypothetical protein
MRQVDETPLSVLIVGCGVLTTRRVRAIRSLSWRAFQTLVIGIGQNCPKAPSVSHYQGKIACESMVRRQEGDSNDQITLASDSNRQHQAFISTRR